MHSVHDVHLLDASYYYKYDASYSSRVSCYECDYYAFHLPFHFLPGTPLKQYNGLLHYYIKSCNTVRSVVIPG
jgi:hypothetical protein